MRERAKIKYTCVPSVTCSLIRISEKTRLHLSLRLIFSAQLMISLGIQALMTL